MSSRFKNALIAGFDFQEAVEYTYGAAKAIDGSEDFFNFSAFALCDNWELKRYEDVESFQSLDPVKCPTDGAFYPYYKFKFKV